MNITEKPEVFVNACLDTPFRAMCLKKRGKSLRELIDDECGHGILVRPFIEQGTVKNDEEFNAILNRLVNKTNGTVVVRGHGWFFERKFVWTGTLAEFNETWEVD